MRGCFSLINKWLGLRWLHLLPLKGESPRFKVMQCVICPLSQYYTPVAFAKNVCIKCGRIISENLVERKRYQLKYSIGISITSRVLVLVLVL